jgi:hypothetical protein
MPRVYQSRVPVRQTLCRGDSPSIAPHLVPRLSTSPSHTLCPHFVLGFFSHTRCLVCPTSCCSSQPVAGSLDITQPHPVPITSSLNCFQSASLSGLSPFFCCSKPHLVSVTLYVHHSLSVLSAGAYAACICYIVHPFSLFSLLMLPCSRY